MFPEPRIWFRACALIVLHVVLLSVAAEEIRCESIRGAGDFEFYFDSASIPTGTGGTIQLLQFAIPTKQLLYVEKAGKHAASVRFTVSLSSKDGIVHKRTFQIKDVRSAMPKVKDLSAFLYAIDSCSVDPGSYRLTAVVEDLQRKEKTLLGAIRGRYLSSSVTDAAVDVRSYSPEKLALADPILVWGFDGSGALIPNPMQIYGLRKDTLGVYVQAAIPESLTADSLTVRLSLNRDTGEPMTDELFKVPVTGNRSAFVRNVDLATYPAGSYRLTVEARSGEGAYVSAGKDFSVAWELVNWQKPARDMLVEARILLKDDDFVSFQKMSLGQQEAFMKKFWKKLDPTPQTGVNESYEKFTARLTYADAHFGAFERGALTDRGQVYIKLGPPDEIIRKPLPQNREDLYEGIDKVITDYKIIADGIMTTKVIKDQRPIIISPEKQRAVRGMVGDDVGSFEIWSYNFKGDPILADDAGMTMKQGMRYMFLDKDGIGVYRIVGTSEEISTNGDQ
ncbi:MAG: GWxTD domain-containing protein [Candidatus Krumholzibacteria bacterium]|nr:GWxTD domain-containing protein [Candidatus Krumholzibacteria bacterium]